MTTITILLLVSAFTCLVVANSYFSEIVGEINARSGEQMNRVGINVRLFDFLDKHRELYPMSRKRLVATRWALLGFALVAAMAVANVANALLQ